MREYLEPEEVMRSGRRAGDAQAPGLLPTWPWAWSLRICATNSSHRVPPVSPSSPVWALNQAIVSWSRVTFTRWMRPDSRAFFCRAAHSWASGKSSWVVWELVLVGPLVCVRILGQLGGDRLLLLRSRPDEVKLFLVHTWLSPSRSPS